MQKMTKLIRKYIQNYIQKLDVNRIVGPQERNCLKKLGVQTNLMLKCQVCHRIINDCSLI